MESAKQKRYQKIAELKAQGLEEAPLLSDLKAFDPKATTEDLIADLRRVAMEADSAYVSREAYRKHGKYSDSTWDSRFGTFKEFRRQAALELSRGQHKLERQIAKHASEDVVRGFFEVEILPQVGKYKRDQSGRWQTAIVASDFHDASTDPFPLGVFIDTCKRVQPDYIVLNGDVFDLYDFSVFSKDPRHTSLVDAFKFVREFIFSPLREACPDAQIDLVLGNHEHRLLRVLAERTPHLKVILSDLMGITLADLLGLPKYEINLIAKNDLSAYKEADIRVQSRRNHSVYWDCFVCDHYADRGYATYGCSGHVHRIDGKGRYPTFRSSADFQSATWWWVNGCMCRVDTEYFQGLTKAGQSFLIVHADTYRKACLPEPIIFGDHSVMVGGQRYQRGVTREQ